jgi:predicted ATP-grasp superfamily ATP-dependent carboligase
VGTVREKIRVLITDSEYKHALAAARSLSRAGYEVFSLGAGKGQASKSKSVVESFFINPNDDETFDSALFDVIDTRKIDALLPIGALSVSRVNSARDALQESVAFALAPRNSMNLALSKSLTIQHAESIGVTCPKTWIFDSMSSLIGGIKTIPLPFVLKSGSELYKFGPIYVHSKDQINDLLTQFELRDAFLFTTVIAQELILGQGVGFFALYQNGDCKRVFMHERLRETPSTGGSSWAARGIYNDNLMESGLTLLDSLNWHGPAMVEYKLHAQTRKPVLMELNPKFWGSLDLAISSGVDFASETVRVALGEKLDTRFDFKVGKQFVWPLENIRSYVSDRSLRGKMIETNVLLADPLPALYQLMQKVALALLGDSVAKTLLYWMMKHSPRDFMSRVNGQLLGLPFRRNCEIDEFLWIGAKPGRIGARFLRAKGFTVRISLLEEEEKTKGPKGLQYFWRPLREYRAIPSQALWGLTSEILDLQGQGSRVFIHCREGVGRAPAVGVALLIRKGHSLESAIDQINSGRTVSSLNSEQIQSLREFYKDFTSSIS